MNPSPKTVILRNFYVPRSIGLGLGFIAVYPSLPLEPTKHYIALFFLVTYCFFWSHIAYLLAKSSPTPFVVEKRSVFFDSCAVGFFAGVIGFDPIPSVAIVSMVTMNAMAMGGPRLALLGVILSLSGAIFAYFTFHSGFESLSLQTTLITCIPLLVLYPMSLGYVCYRTAHSLQYQKKQLRIISRTDYLTGLLNRSAVNEVIANVIAHSHKELQNSVIALVDVDYFKQVNDSEGHGAGDNVLKSIASIMLSCTRAQDTLGRLGGDEFCIVLRDVTQAEALKILTNICVKAREKSIKIDSKVAAGTLTIGAACYSPICNTLEKWLEQADHAMYEAKRKGRNQVSFYTG